MIGIDGTQGGFNGQADREGAVRYDMRQTLSEQQKKQARDNIGVQHTPQVSGLRKMSDYLYEIEYGREYDYAYAYRYFRDMEVQSMYGCLSFRNGNIYGRNLDWIYDEAVSFIIRTPKVGHLHASVGVAGMHSKLTKEAVEKGTETEAFRILPFLTLDGVNDSGVFVNSNVVSANEDGWIKTTGTTPTGTLEQTICMPMIPRFILDHFATAAEAVDYIKGHCSIYAPNIEKLSVYELHFMVGDADSTYIVEFENNEIYIESVSGGTVSHPAVMTNFRIKDSSYDDSSKKIDYSTVSPYGSGLERYNIAADGLNEVVNVESAAHLLKRLYATKTYTLPEDDDYWYTEFVGKYDGFELTVDDAVNHREKFGQVIQEAKRRYQDRSRDPESESFGTWQTVYSCVYDLANGTLTICSQEDENEIFGMPTDDSGNVNTATDEDIDNLFNIFL